VLRQTVQLRPDLFHVFVGVNRSLFGELFDELQSSDRREVPTGTARRYLDNLCATRTKNS